MLAGLQGLDQPDDRTVNPISIVLTIGRWYERIGGSVVIEVVKVIQISEGVAFGRSGEMETPII